MKLYWIDKGGLFKMKFVTINGEGNTDWVTMVHTLFGKKK